MLAVVAVAAFSAIAPSAWVDVKRAMRGHFDSFEDVVGPAAKRTADWLGDGVGTVRDALAQEVAGATVSGPARVVDGDTLEVRGDARASAWHRRPGEQAAVPLRGAGLALRPRRHPRARPADRLAHRRV